MAGLAQRVQLERKDFESGAGASTSSAALPGRVLGAFQVGRRRGQLERFVSGVSSEVERGRGSIAKSIDRATRANGDGSLRDYATAFRSFAPAVRAPVPVADGADAADLDASARIVSLAAGGPRAETERGAIYIGGVADEELLPHLRIRIRGSEGEFLLTEGPHQVVPPAEPPAPTSWFVVQGAVVEPVDGAPEPAGLVQARNVVVELVVLRRVFREVASVEEVADDEEFATWDVGGDEVHVAIRVDRTALDTAVIAIPGRGAK